MKRAPRTMSRVVTRLILCPAVMLILFACGGSDPAANAQSSEPEVDPRFASAEALIDHFNDLNRGEVINFHDEIALYYAENDFQQRIIGALRYMAFTQDLQNACQRRFGMPLGPSWDFYTENAKLTQVEGERARALATGETATERELYLVKIGDRWWLSGYTFEYSDEYSDPVGLEFMESSAHWLERFVPRIVQRIENGDFSSVEEVREAFAEEAMREGTRNALNQGRGSGGS